MGRHSAVVLVTGVALGSWMALTALEAAPIGTAFTYQGKLADGGVAAEGSYDLQFALFDAAISGSQVGPTVTRDDVAVVGGLFTVSLDFGAVFEGSARFLEIGIRPGDSTGSYTAMSVRQELTAAPNALAAGMAASAPWTGLTGVPAGFADGIDNAGAGGTVTSVGTGSGLTGGPITSSGTISVDFGTTGTTVAAGDHDHFEQAWGGSSPDYALTLSNSGSGGGLRSLTSNSNGVGVYAESTSSTGFGVGLQSIVRGTTGAAVYALATESTGTSYALYGEASSGSGYGVWGANFGGGYAGYFLGRTHVEGDLSVSGSMAGSSGLAVTNPAVGGMAVQGNATGTNGTGVFGYSSAPAGYGIGVRGLATGSSASGVEGRASATTGQTSGVFGESDSSQGTGVFGLADSSTGQSYGVYGVAWSPEGQGVSGRAAATSGWTAGVYGQTESSSGYGVYGQAMATEGSAIGAYGRSWSPDGIGVYGDAPSSTGFSRGVFGIVFSPAGMGVDGRANETTGPNYGVHGQTLSSAGFAVFGDAAATTGRNFGVFGYSSSSAGVGVHGMAAATTGTNFGVVGQSNSPAGYDFYANGAGLDWGSSSSIRWKHDVQPIEDPLGKLGRLRGVSFTWNEDVGGGHDLGMIAEEVGAVLPEIVRYEANGTDAVAMDYSRLAPLLVEAVKEQQKTIEGQQKTIEEQRSLIESLLSRVTALESAY